MRICLIHQYYKTPETGGAIRTFYIARHLAEKGHEVVVVTAGNQGDYHVDTLHGYPVHYLPVYYENHLGFLSRIHAFLLFVWKANKLLKRLGKFDLNYVVTTPLTTGFIASRAKRLYNTPYIFEVGDLWPEAPIQLGVIRNPIFKWLAYRFEKRFYNQAKAIVALSPAIRDAIQVKAPDKQIEVITNFADTSLFSIADSSVNLKHKYDCQDKLVISYLGTLGLANHLELMLDAAEHVKDLPVKFLVVGGGARFEAIRKKAEARELDQIAFYKHRNKFDLHEIVSITDMVYVSFQQVPVLQTGSPNKFFDGLAAGKAIILNFKGWIKDLVEANECGFYYDPLDTDKFRERLLTYLEGEKLENAKQNSSSLADRYTPAIQLKKLDILIRNIKI